MTGLPDYVLQHVQRGECRCGQCIDAHEGPEARPTGHTVDMVFFRASTDGNADLNEYRRLTSAHRGEFANVNPFDGYEHNFLELGAWIGDQGLAMQYMALGVSLGAFKLLSPVTIFGLRSDDPTTMQMAGAGFLSVCAEAAHV